MDENVNSRLEKEKQLSRHLGEFTGYFVAIKDSKVVAFAKSGEELRELLKENQIDYDRTFKVVKRAILSKD